MPAKILISTSSFSEVDQTPINTLTKSGFSVIKNPHGRKLTKNEVVDLLEPDVIGMIAGLETLDREVLQKSKLKVISRCGSGLDNVDMVAAQELNIKVRATFDAPTNSVAELTLSCLLGLLRAVPYMNSELHHGRWSKKIGSELNGKTVAIIGFGRIGRRLSELFQPFEISLIVVDPYLLSPVPYGAILTLDEALPKADIISLHCSGNACVLGAREFALMKKGVVILNAARGALIDEAAFLSAVKSGRVAGAWLDVFNEEPYQGILRNEPSVLLTPHVGSYTRECRGAMEMESVENLLTELHALMHKNQA